MRISVSGWPALHLEQLRAYAEYRVFTQLAALADQVKRVHVVVSRSADDRMTSCVMSVELENAMRIQARGRDAQPIRAVDSAAKRLAGSVAARGSTSANT
jgi:ribosome-associated translation inhibitor RaiA